LIRRLFGKAARSLQRFGPRNRPAILMYHRIADETFDPWGLCVHPARFEEQLDWLARNRAVLPLPEFLRMKRDGHMPDDATAITFDDGYACAANLAAPRLARAGMHATVFLPVRLIASDREFWWDELERIVLAAPVARLRVDGNETPLGSPQDDDRYWRPYAAPKTPRQKAFLQLWAWLGPLRHKKREAVLADLRQQAGSEATARQSHRPMTVAEVRSLDPSTMDFGSHGLTHADLLAISDDEKADEIGASFDACAELTGRTPKAFAYPHGRFDAECERIAELSGYELACSTKQAFVSTRSSPFALPRLAVTNEPNGLLVGQGG